MRRLGFKQNKSIKPTLFLIGFFATAVAAALLVFRSNFFTIRNIEVKLIKVSCLNDNEIKESSDLLGQNFFLINTAETSLMLKKKFLCIKSINFSKVIPDNIKMEVTGRDPAAKIISVKWEASASSLIDNLATPSAELIQGIYVVDQEGIIFTKDIGEEIIPKIYVLREDLSLGAELDDSLKNSLKILENLKKFNASPTEVMVFDKLLIINGVPKMIFNLDTKIETQIASLQLILNKAKIDDMSLEFIDLRFDKPIIRFAPKKNG